MKRRVIATVVLGTAILLAANTSGAQTTDKSVENFKVRLSVVPLDVSMMSTIAGSGSLTATLTGRKLAITGTFAGLRSPATIAQIHRGPKGIPDRRSSTLP